jgi:hypothetical protein
MWLETIRIAPAIQAGFLFLHFFIFFSSFLSPLTGSFERTNGRKHLTQPMWPQVFFKKRRKKTGCGGAD